MASLMASKSCEDELKRFSEVEQNIRFAFDEIIKVARNRKDQLLSQLQKMKMEYLDKEEETNKQKCEIQKLIAQTLDVSLHQNVIVKMQTDQIDNLKKELKNYETPIPHPHFKTDHLDSILQQIDELGNLDEIAGEYLLKLKPVGSIGNTGNKKVDFANPRGIALDDQQRIYIADYENGRILIFPTKGELIEQFGKGQLIRPHDIAITENWVFVSDLGLNVVYKFSRVNHRYITRSAENEIGCPRGIAVDKDGDVYLAIKYDNIVAVFNTDMKLSRSIGSGKLNQPCDVKINNNAVFVVDRNEVNNLHIFAKTGDLLKSFLKLGKGEGDIYFCFDKYSNILISDYSRSSIKIFTENGELIQRIESKGRPTGIVVNDSCVIFSGHINVISMY